MKYAVVFLAFAAVCVFGATQTASWPVQIGALWCALAFGGVGLAYAFVGPRAFGKRDDGTLSLWSRALYSPYFGLNALSLWGFRRSSRENDFDEIAPNIFLGCLLNQSDHAAIERLGVKSVFDLTSEFGETGCLRQLNYRCQPLLDTHAPSLDELQAGANWIVEATRRGPVYVHCALGHGRSATLVAAALMLSGRAPDAETAVEQIRQKRLHIRFDARAIRRFATVGRKSRPTTFVKLNLMSRSFIRFLPLALTSVLVFASAPTQAQPSRIAIPINQQGTRAYAAIEVAFQWPNFTGDPFDYQSHDVRVRFAAPGGEIVSLPAFYDGDATWRVRHTPKVPGVYRVVGVFDNGRQLNLRAQPQRFNVSNASALGSAWVRVDARNPRRFSLADGTRFYPFGLNQAWTGGEQKGYEEKFAQLQNSGLNWSRIWMNHWDGKNLDWSQSGKLPIGQIDLKAARRWDDIIKSADRHNVYVQMAIQHHGQYSLKVNPNWDENPWNAKNGGFLQTPDEFFTNEKARELTKRKLRYIVARYGYSPHIMAWELWNEVQFTAAGQDKKWDDVANWHREMAEFVREQDVYDHLVTTSSDVPPSVYAPLDYYQHHAYPIYLIPSLSARHFAGSEWPVKPEFVGEFGPDNTKDRPDEWTMHSGLWAGLMSDAGGAAQYWEGDRVERDNYYFHFAAASGLLRASDFARQDGRKPARRVAAAIDTPDRTALKLTFNGGWGAVKQSEFDLSNPASASEFSKLPSYFQGDNHRDMNPVPLKLQLNLPRPATLTLTLAQVAKAGANLRVGVGSKTVDYAFPATDADTKPNREIAIPVAAGPQTVTLENTGQDWILLGALSVPEAAPILDGYVKANGDWMMGWFFHRDNIEAANPQGSASGTALVSPVDAGNYRVTWWDTLAGKPLQTTVMRADDKGLRLQIPPVQRDIAVWAQKVK